MIAAIALAAALPAPGAGPSLAQLVEAVLRQGPKSTLPVHLAAVLGISASGQGLEVKQAVLRDGPTVHTFNVRIANPADIVMMSVDERTRATRAYRVTAAGVLRKAVSYQEGAAAQQRSLRAARSDFENEMKSWAALNLMTGPAPRLR